MIRTGGIIISNTDKSSQKKGKKPVMPKKPSLPKRTKEKKTETHKRAGKPNGKKGFNWKKLGTIFGYLCCLGVVVGCIAAIALSVYLVDVTEGDNINLNDTKLSFTSIIYYQDKETGEYKEYQRLAGDENRVWVGLDDIPLHVQNAFIAVEDKDFYSHKGVNFVRTFAAMINEYTPIKLFDSKTGASTITQQLIKNLTNDKAGSGIQGALRKVREIFRALVLEKQYSKDEILECYLNTLRLSNTWAGVQAGANNYFGKDIKDLTIAEAALLAGITKNPSRYNPYRHPEASKERRDDILYFMHQQGKISTEEYEAGLAEEVVLNDSIQSNSSVNSYFTDMIINQVIDDLVERGWTKGDAEHAIYNEGLRIYSTVDPTVQTAMENVMLNENKIFKEIVGKYTENGEKKEQLPQAAMVSVDYNGAIVACVGGLGEKTADRVLNRAVDAPRQTGSTMKPIGAYAMAMEYQYINYSTTLYDDYCWEIKDEKTGAMKKWPINYGDVNGSKYSMNDIPVVHGIKKSLNTIAVRTLMMLGVNESYDFCKNTLHISTLTEGDRDYAPMALGALSNGITPLEMAAAYAIFGNGGKYITPYCYTTVETAEGEVLLETKVTTVQAISEETAYIMNRALRTVLHESGGTSFGGMTKKMDSVGKTGTSSDDKDHWFIGVTPYYSTACWWGYDYPQALPWKDFGGKHPPTMAWRDVMNEAQKDLKSISFKVPKNVQQQMFCVASGNLANANCPEQETGYYTKDNPLSIVCQVH